MKRAEKQKRAIDGTKVRMITGVRGTIMDEDTPRPNKLYHWITTDLGWFNVYIDDFKILDEETK